MKLGIGIDTGGTYTDAVLYDFEDGAILGTAKALTTRDDLSKGILSALDGLPAERLSETSVLSLSTTLATNACVEGKGGRAKLIFFGGNRKVIDELGPGYGLPPSSEIHIQEGYTTLSGESTREPDWELFCRCIDESFQGLDGAGILEMNATNNGGAIEKKAKELFQRHFPIPVICGHELYSERNSLQRGASTLLNAQLFPVIQEFLDAIQIAMEQRRLHPSVVIVRSDGSLMSESFARLHPVETLLCGPAASVMGSAELTKADNGIVVDMGGTTTDIALVRGGTPVKVTQGVCIGKWKTFVSGLYIKTIGLGGDSAIHYRDSRLLLEEFRVIPLCVAASRHPQVLAALRELVDSGKHHTQYLHEQYLLIRDIRGETRYTPEEQAFCQALKNGPLPRAKAAESVGKDLYTLDVSRLLKEGVVQLCGLTPTDIMHLRGDFTRYSAKASRLGAEFVARNLGVTVEELCGRVYDEICRKIYWNVAQALLENQYPETMKKGVGPDLERFLLDQYEAQKDGKRGDLLSIALKTSYPLIGVGAPIKVFLPEVARKLGTQAVIPPHYEVANALGAVVGNVCVSYKVEVRPCAGTEEITGYVVYGNGLPRTFAELEDAEAFARAEAEEGARGEAYSRGAVGDIAVTSELQRDEAQAAGFSVYLGTTVVAQAVGGMQL